MNQLLRHSSSVGGSTLLAGLFVLQGLVQLVFNAVEGQIQINRDIIPINEIKIDLHWKLQENGQIFRLKRQNCLYPQIIQ